MITGLVITPCIFPVLGAILTFISLKKNVIWGAINLFCFALGYGLILIVLGTFASLISKLPKVGFWNIIVKKIIGWLLIGSGMYFLLKILR